MSRAMNRHHAKRVKAKRSKYYTAFHSIKPTGRTVGRAARTPCVCSCWMCGHQRKNHGMNMQEVRARLKYTD